MLSRSVRSVRRQFSTSSVELRTTPAPATFSPLPLENNPRIKTANAKAALRKLTLEPQKAHNWKYALQLFDNIEKPDETDYHHAITCCEASLQPDAADTLFMNAVANGIQLPCVFDKQLTVTSSELGKLPSSDTSPSLPRRTIDLTSCSLGLSRVAIRHALSDAQKLLDSSTASAFPLDSVSLAAAAAAAAPGESLQSSEILHDALEAFAARRTAKRQEPSQLVGHGTGAQFRLQYASSKRRRSLLSSAPINVEQGLNALARGAPHIARFELNSISWKIAESRTKSLLTAASQLAKAPAELYDLYITTPRGHRPLKRKESLQSTYRALFRGFLRQKKADEAAVSVAEGDDAVKEDVADASATSEAESESMSGLAALDAGHSELSSKVLRARVRSMLSAELGLASSLVGQRQIKISGQQLLTWVQRQKSNRKANKVLE